MEIYGSYKKARNASWKVLIDFNMSKLPVNVLDIAYNANVEVIKNSNINMLKENESAISFMIDGNWYIVYDDAMLKERARFSIAHELGHIFLGHPLSDEADYFTRKTFDKTTRPLIETEADMFAARLLAPACVLWGLHLHSPWSICNVCCISYAAAKIRSKRMDVLYKRNKFLTSRLERQVYTNFRDFIVNTNAPHQKIV